MTYLKWILGACLIFLGTSSFSQAPANDACANAIVIPLDGTILNASNTNTVTDTPNPTCGGTAIKDVWYKFVYPGGNITITTGLGTLTDTRVAAYAACPGTTPIACNDDIGGSNYASQIVLTCTQLTIGNTYYIQAGGYNSTTGTFTIRAQQAAVSGCMDNTATNYNPCATINGGGCVYSVAMTNDICANAIALTPNAPAISVTNTGTTSDGPNPSCGGTGIKDIWFKFTHTGGSVTIQTTGTVDTRLAVYNSCGGTMIACDDDDSPAGNNAMIKFGCPVSNGTNGANEDDVLVVGQTYYIQAGGYNAVTGTFTIQVSSAIVTGCMDPQATNYNACATVSDGNCTYPALAAAFNYSPPGTNCLELTFHDVSAGNITSRSWSFPGATPSSSTEQNPTVTYPTGGIYTATLVVNDAFGATQTLNQNVIVETGHVVTIDITNDNLPQQTTWKVFDNNNVVVQQGTGDAAFCIVDNCHRFEIYDSGNNGICCANGNGSYTIYLDGISVATGASFTSVDIRDINCPQGSSCSNPIVATLGTLAVPEPNTWYSFTPAVNGQYRISTCGLADCDTKIWVYDYCNMALFDNTNEATYTYNDDLCGVQAEVTPFLTGGDTYYVRVGDTGGSCGITGFQVLFEYMGPIVGCMDILACNYNPLASAPNTCYYNGDPNCSNLGPDLYVDGNLLYSSTALNTYTTSDACLVNEGCMQGLGTRNIVRFSTRIDNIGTQDYFIGVPNANNPQFEYDLCHNHYHYEGYAEYLLFDDQGNPMPQIGFKNGFCVLDLGCTTGQAKFGCGNMGITAGCYDVYSSGLSCQWIDITDVPAGSYHLVVRTNWDQSPDANGRYELRYDNNWAQVCISFGRDANNNIINFTKTNVACNALEDCLGQPWGDTYPDCQGNCPGVVKRGDLVSDNVYDNADVAQYATSTFVGSTPVSPCTDLNSDGAISVADAAYLDECIHQQFDLGVPAQLMEECPWDPEIIDGDETVTLGITNINTAGGYFDIAITNPNGEISALEFEISGATIDHVTNLLPSSTWDAHIYAETEGDHITVLGHFGTRIPVNVAPAGVLRVFYSSLESNTICVSSIVDVLNVFLHNVNASIGACQNVVTIQADFEANTTSVCQGQQVAFSDLTLGVPTSWSWSFPGGTPSTSTAQNPMVNYYVQGVYPVTLTASNATTNDSETKTAYITVSSTITQYLDADGDGYGNGAVTASGCGAIPSYVTVPGDCNDLNGSQYPGATEVCNNIDDNCDTSIDEGFDADNDGYTTCGGDCDDNSAIVYPGSAEICNGADEDCDTLIDEGFDADGDGFAICQNDCDDGDPTIRPSANEICDNIDNNCNGAIDEGYDGDNDGFATCDGDCNDANEFIFPGADEICNNIDDDCNTIVDDGFDNDGDGFSTCENDCDDTKSGVYPGATEVCGNGIDDDCDTAIDEGFDLDGDGYQTCQGDCADLDPFRNPGASEICDNLDNNCNGLTDEGFDADNDGFSVCDNDCNDNNALINPSRLEACGTLIDEDCDGLVDEACGTGMPNDQPISAQPVPVTTTTTCTPMSGTLVGADASPLAQTTCITGEDLWYSFTAISTGIRIKAETSSSDLLIELQDANGNLIDYENAVSGVGSEILNFGNLQEGAIYRVGIRNYNSTLGNGPFALCINRLQDSQCNYGPGPYSLCGMFKAVYTGAQQYVFHFTSTTTGATYTGNSNYGNSRINFSEVQGMRWNDTYSCRIDAVYTLSNGSGQNEVVTVVGNTSCPVIIAQHPLTELRLQDRCPTQRNAYSYVSCNPWVCGAVDFDWEFTQISPSVGLPVVVRRGSGDRFFQMSQLPGIVAPATYSVRVRPVFPLNVNGTWGSAQCLQIVGSAGMVLNEEELYAIEDRLLEEQSTEPILQVYPNPSLGNAIGIAAYNLTEGLVTAKIFDAMGREVLTEKWAVEGYLSTTWEFASPLAAGQYTLQLITEDDIRTVKLMIEK